MTKVYHRKNKYQRSKKRKAGKQDRLKFLVVLFFLIGGIIILRLFNLQILQHDFYEALALGQHELYQKLFPERGEIYAQDPYAQEGTYKIASNRDYNLIYANPKKVDQDKVEEMAKEIALILNLDEEDVKKRLRKENDLYEPLKNKATDLEVEAVQELGYAGIDFRAEAWRYYPEGNYTSHLTGFLGYTEEEKKGQYGLEGYFEEELAGQDGYLRSERDAGGRFIAVGDQLLTEAEDGKDIYLTIDKNVQFYVCDLLKQSVEKHGADEGTVIVVEPETGAIISMCNYPDFDPNDYSDIDDLSVFMNSAISDEYESGSVFKTFALASAIDLGKLGPESTYTDTGEVTIGEYTIKNSDEKAYGVSTMNEVLANSLNTGAIYAVQQAGNEAFYNHVQRLGFGEETGIELSGEADGDISELAKLADIYSATCSYGQGLTVTPLQLIMAYATFANGGTLMRPYLIDKIVYASGYEEQKEPEVVREVVQPQTARLLSAMLVNVVDSGHAQHAAVEGYYIGGKTGTAQVPKENGKGYYEHRHKDTFVGYGPISDPQFVILAKIDEPKDVAWSAGSAAPLFGDIAKFLVNYYHIPPDRE